MLKKNGALSTRIKKGMEESSGVVTLETAISLTIFLFVFLIIFGMVRIVVAQNYMTHALVQSTKSLSLDPYRKQTLGGTTTDFNQFFSKYGDVCDDYKEVGIKKFSGTGDWYPDGPPSEDEVSRRFFAFLCGDDNSSSANEMFKMLGIKDGASGVDFDVRLDGKDIVVTIQYTIEYWMDAIEGTDVNLEQTYRSRIWVSR